jgi:hypothetical protein
MNILSFSLFLSAVLLFAAGVESWSPLSTLADTVEYQPHTRPSHRISALELLQATARIRQEV